MYAISSVSAFITTVQTVLCHRCRQPVAAADGVQALVREIRDTATPLTLVHLHRTCAASAAYISGDTYAR